MAILNYANQLNASRQGALSGMLQNTSRLQGLGFNEENMQRQRDQDAAQRQQEQNKIALSKEAQEVFARNDVNEIAAFSVANPTLGRNILASKGIVDAAGKERVSDRFANVLTSTNPQEALTREVEKGEAAGLDMTQSKEILAQGLSPEGIKQAAGMALASIDGQRFKDIQQSSGLGSKKPQFAPQVSSLQTDPETGQKYIAITNRNTGQVKRVDVKDAIGETLQQEQDRGFRKESLKDARIVSKEAFGELKGIKSSVRTIDEAITAIDKGAEAGFIDKFLPSFTESTIALENAAQRMGLDVISATTFGALSEGELRLAMDTAMPRNLEPKELKTWLVDRKKAKNKLANELTKMAITLGKGKVTISEYLESNATFDYNKQEQQETQQGQPANQDQQALDWANANPDDPRSAQILNKLRG